MDEDRKKYLRITAQMEGQSVIVGGIGKKIELSEMEIICLVNLAQLGILSVFAQLDGTNGEEAVEELNDHLDVIRKVFSRGDNGDGLDRLMHSTLALITVGRLAKYVAD